MGDVPGSAEALAADLVSGARAGIDHRPGTISTGSVSMLARAPDTRSAASASADPAASRISEHTEIPTPEEDEGRSPGPCLHVAHPADGDRVVARLVLQLEVALDPGDGTVEHR